MPIYDYKCRSCEKQFEFLVLKSRAAACPGCGSRKLEQLPSTGIAVSSASTRKSNLEKARGEKKYQKTRRDKKVAELDEVKDYAP
jgi:putative FmdB family regulatory protein